MDKKFVHNRQTLTLKQLVQEMQGMGVACTNGGDSDNIILTCFTILGFLRG